MTAYLALLACLVPAFPGNGQVLDKPKLLNAQTFWDNRDWDWYQAQIPFLETPDGDLDTTYYYRWELVTKHLTYGSPRTGYVFTEFIDRPFWSGTYGAISCPAGHQLYEVRWLADPRYARDYARYWFRTPGAEPRRYSCWLADAVWAAHQVHPDEAWLTDLLPDLEANYRGWEASHFVPEVGLFWQTGHDDGMEININSRQTRDTVRGAPAYRPTLNAYLYADARAIARIARLAGKDETAAAYDAKADRLAANLRKLWDPKRQFFFPMARQDEEKDGHVVKAGSLTYQTGQYAGDPHGRELIGYVPWMVGMPGPEHAPAWRFLMDPDRFFAPFGPTVTERHDPLFLVTKTCCVWSGQSWPYATTQTLVAMANLLNGPAQKVVTKADYVKLLQVYARTHRKNGRPYLAEAADPDTGSWEGYDSPNHSEHYFHSGFADLIVTGLAGLRPRSDDVLEVNPLIPDDWAYFALDDVLYRGRRVAIVWDKTGTRYGRGVGLRILADGRTMASSPTLARLTAELPKPDREPSWPRPMNFAVNNDGGYYPRASVSSADPATPPDAVNDGGAWYHTSPANRWTCDGSGHERDWCAIDFGVKRCIHTIKLYVLDDAARVVAPARIEVDSWDGRAWVPIPDPQRHPEAPVGHRANTFTFAPIETSRVRAVLAHRAGVRCGLSELEAWGAEAPGFTPAPPPSGNVAVNPRGEGYPAASASFTSRFDSVAMVNDGRVVFRPTPHNRWTAYESPSATDWVAIDFGTEKVVDRADLHIYDDRGGVQAPKAYVLERWDGARWSEIPGQKKDPPRPAGGRVNTVTFPALATRKLRVVFEHNGAARSGLSELEVWEASR
jgi:hypothetical protein